MAWPPEGAAGALDRPPAAETTNKTQTPTILPTSSRCMQCGRQFKPIPQVPSRCAACHNLELQKRRIAAHFDFLRRGKP